MRSDAKGSPRVNVVAIVLILAAAAVALALSGCGTAPVAGTAPAPPAAPVFRLSGGATTGPLAVRRVEIVFPNGRGEIMVPRSAALRAEAVIRFNGNGPFRAVWVVDGRPVEIVAQMIAFGDTLTLGTSPATVLPTFEPGPHTVTLRIEQPAPPFPVPVVSYIVTGDEAPARPEGAR